MVVKWCKEVASKSGVTQPAQLHLRVHSLLHHDVKSVGDIRPVNAAMVRVGKVTLGGNGRGLQSSMPLLDLEIFLPIVASGVVRSPRWGNQ